MDIGFCELEDCELVLRGRDLEEGLIDGQAEW